MPVPTDAGERGAPGRKRVLPLRTGDSARSQMAEGLVNHLLGDRREAHSAGPTPPGFVHSLAVEAVRELAGTISSLRSKSVEEFRSDEFDLVMPAWSRHGGLLPGRRPAAAAPFPGASRRRIRAARYGQAQEVDRECPPRCFRERIGAVGREGRA